jgi:hypothetical protein
MLPTRAQGSVQILRQEKEERRTKLASLAKGQLQRYVDG